MIQIIIIQEECEYSDCKYQCDDILNYDNGAPKDPKNLDYSTYNLYYNNEEINKNCGNCEKII